MNETESPSEREFEDAHFHDEEPEIVRSDGEFDAEGHGPRPLRGKKRPSRRPPPRRRYLED